LEIVTDLHLHSKYSRAVSKQMDLVQIAKWAKIKGVDLVGTGDFTHPMWFKELKENLEEDNGVFTLVQSSKCKVQSYSSKFKVNEVKFLLTSEISSIYSQGGKTRKIHNLVMAPDFTTVEKINSELTRRGFNIKSDGRPIIKLSAHDLLDMVLSINKDCLVIPAHIWTPWFSMYGANSGYDSIIECFGDLEKYIYAIETGLSSDPEMNWRIPELEGRSIVSFSDAHSGSKLGREATVLEIGRLDYERVIGAIRGRGERREEGDEKIKYTIEFYPEEGKYHWTGHRNCNVIYSPEESIKKGTICPVCGKKLTVGVAERVERLGVRNRVRVKEEIDEYGVRWVKPFYAPPNRRATEGKKGKGDKTAKFVRLVPLLEIISQSLKSGESSQKVVNGYNKLTDHFGSELKILMQIKPEEIANIGGEKIAEGIIRVRLGNIYIRPGFDGEFGKVKVWSGKDEANYFNKKPSTQLEIF